MSLNLVNTLRKSGSNLTPAWIFCALLGLTILLGACAKGNNMGSLRGQWQLLSIELPDGRVESTVSDESRRYISFDQNIVQLTATDHSADKFQKAAGSVSGESPDLKFYFPNSEDVIGRELLAKWGIYDNPVEIKVVSQKGDRLILKAGTSILTLRKF